MNNRVRIFSLISTPLIFASCMPAVQQTGAGGAGGVYQDPNNPYAVPGVTTQGGAVSQTPYQAPTTSAPYQPIPTTPINPPASLPVQPSYPASIPTSTSGGGSHTVTSGDTLWGLSKKYGVSADQIRQANGISGDKIITGQTLSIPQ